MNKKQYAVQVLQHQDGGEQTRLDGFGDLPELDFITDYEPAQDSIAALLPHTRGNALTTQELARISDLAPREITRRICAERRAGAPILSDPGAGFWLAADADELMRCTAQLNRRAAQIHKTACALEKCLSTWQDRGPDDAEKESC